MSKTESVKASKIIMDKVRTYKERTGIPLTKIIDRALLIHIGDEKVICEGCENEILLADAKMDEEDGNWFCPMCVKEMTIK